MCFEYFSDRASEITRSLLQSCQDFLLFFVAAEYANVNDGCLQVRRRLDLGHASRRFLDSRVLDLLTEQQTQLPLNLTIDFFNTNINLLTNQTKYSLTESRENARSYNNSLNLNYELKTDSLGSKLNLNAAYLNYRRFQNSIDFYK